MIALPVYLLYIYGVLLIVGGVIGYVKANSVPSLVAGTVCGLIAIFLAFDYTWHYAPYCAIALAVVLTFIMGRRYLNTRKAMPALLIVVLSILVILTQLCLIFSVGVGNDRL